MTDYTNADAKRAFAARTDVKAFCAALLNLKMGDNEAILAAASKHDPQMIRDYIGFQQTRCNLIAYAQQDAPTSPEREVIPAPVITEKAPSRKKASAKANESARADPWRLGHFDSDYGQKRIAVFLRRRRCSLAGQAEADSLQALASEVKADFEKSKGKSKKPSAAVLDSIGKSQLPPAAIEWLMRFGYDFKADEAELLEEARVACAYAILKERYVYLPDCGEAYRVSDRKGIKESAAIGEMQKWFGDGVADHVIRRALRTHCSQATGKVRVPGRDVRFLHDGRWVVNEWAPPPWPEVNATDADVKPFTDLVHYQAEEDAEAFFDWMAAHVQPEHWHKHQRWGLISISDYQQTGREAVLNIFSRAAGIQNRTNGMLAELEKGPELAAYLARGSFVVFSEAHVGFQQLERLKEVMGSERALVRTMNKNAEYIHHGVTIAILSNDPQCVKLGADNQRFMVIRNTKPRMDHNADGTKKKPDEPGFSAYDDLRKWEDDNGPAKLLSWLRRRDLSKHNFETRPYATAAELELVDSALSPVITDIKDLIVGREGPFSAELIELDVARRDIAEGVDLPGANAFKKEVSNFDMRNALKAAGAVSLGQHRVRTLITKRVGKEAETKVLDRPRVSLWALANADRWRDLKSDEAPTIRGHGLGCASIELAMAKAGIAVQPASEANVTPIRPAARRRF